MPKNLTDRKKAEDNDLALVAINIRSFRHNERVIGAETKRVPHAAAHESSDPALLTAGTIAAVALVATGAAALRMTVSNRLPGLALDAAAEAALAHTGGGRVTDTESGDQDSYYEVEVTLPNGTPWTFSSTTSSTSSISRRTAKQTTSAGRLSRPAFRGESPRRVRRLRSVRMERCPIVVRVSAGD